MTNIRVDQAVALTNECTDFRIVAFMLIGVLIAIACILAYAWVRDQA